MHGKGIILTALATLFYTACADPTDLCAPADGRVGFFSRGDCVFTRASFFAGHEWLTHFANQDAPETAKLGATPDGNTAFFVSGDGQGSPYACLLSQSVDELPNPTLSGLREVRVTQLIYLRGDPTFGGR